MLSHIISFSFVGFIVYTAQPGSTLFSWHPVLMTLAFATLVVEAVLALARNSVFGSNQVVKARGHWILMLLAVASALAGFAAVYLTKEKNNKPHFATPHGISGGITILYILVQCCAGINVLNPALATKFVPLRTLKKAHGISGLFLFLLACLTITGGLTSEWFTKKVAGSPIWYACLACPLILLVLLARQVFSKSTAAKKQS